MLMEMLQKGLENAFARRAMGDMEWWREREQCLYAVTCSGMLEGIFSDMEGEDDDDDDDDNAAQGRKKKKKKEKEKGKAPRGTLRAAAVALIRHICQFELQQLLPTLTQQSSNNSNNTIDRRQRKIIHLLVYRAICVGSKMNEIVEESGYFSFIFNLSFYLLFCCLVIELIFEHQTAHSASSLKPFY
jgi:hypothetical protein